MAPILLYGYPDWLPMPLRIHIYLEEKKIPTSVVYPVESDEDAAEKGLPAKPDGVWCPIMAVPKADKPGEYTWIEQSLAMIEYLEDYCDAHPEVSPVTSLRGSPDDLVRRSQLRGMALWADEAFALFGYSCWYGNRHYYETLKRVDLNEKVAKDLAQSSSARALKPYEALIPSVVDLDAVASGKEGTVTIADIIMFASWQYAAQSYGVDYAKGLPNLTKFIEAFKKRPSAGRKYLSPYPPGVEKYATSWIDGVWN